MNISQNFILFKISRPVLISKLFLKQQETSVNTEKNSNQEINITIPSNFHYASSLTNHPSIHPLIVSRQTINLATNKVNYLRRSRFSSSILSLIKMLTIQASPRKEGHRLSTTNAIIGRDIIGMEIFRGNGHEAGPDPPRDIARVTNNATIVVE